MLHDIKCGLINTVIVKDISRFGRNYIETGRYLEIIFPRIGIRFISVSEDIDSLDKSNKEFDELVHLESKQRQVHDKINLLKLVVEELKDPNNKDNDSIPKLECVIKKVRVFDNKLDIEKFANELAGVIAELT